MCSLVAGFGFLPFFAKKQQLDSGFLFVFNFWVACQQFWGPGSLRFFRLHLLLAATDPLLGGGSLAAFSCFFSGLLVMVRGPVPG